jgi:hypothetical protein
MAQARRARRIAVRAGANRGVSDAHQALADAFCTLSEYIPAR